MAWHCLDHLGKVVSVELLETGGVVTKRMGFEAVESVKETSDIDIPVYAEIVKVNINTTYISSQMLFLHAVMAYEDGWIIKLKPSRLDELDFLIDPKGYTKFCEEEDASH
ncbi:hypothetical protein C5167_009299 [Papaver somniferum]|uniref:Glycine cleavage system H protein n=1 Tax=Papaver somniferum TaxID=3469 RepID=A0A4Y7K0X2_PAPSO|nr:hypothetical protein C5167_009299 [Papaver somniferum]